MNIYLSNKLKIVSSILIILLLFIHASFNSHYGYQSMLYLQFIFGKELGDLTVSFFFIISVYLIFNDSNTKSFNMKYKLRCSFETLFIPYICSCFLITSFYFFLIFEMVWYFYFIFFSIF